MGLLRRLSQCGCKPSRLDWTIRCVPNPNPGNFKINAICSIGEYCIVDVVYPDCTNYEGRKILVYKGVPHIKIVSAKVLDPHFCEGKDCISPIARFRPTDDGWNSALQWVQVETWGFRTEKLK